MTVTIRVPIDTPVADYLGKLADDYGMPAELGPFDLSVAFDRDRFGEEALGWIIAQLTERAGGLPVTICYQAGTGTLRIEQERPADVEREAVWADMVDA